METPLHEEILAFWFEELEPAQWWRVDPALDDAIGQRFGPTLEANLAAERRHKAIIDRFGRYPHRNAILARVSTAQELAFLQEPGSSF
ncbi:MAG: hypothetical protein RI988_4141 [Pseudomonadota bacterium]|jgi:uncharacterized protein (DUF924 family)